MVFKTFVICTFAVMVHGQAIIGPSCYKASSGYSGSSSDSCKSITISNSGGDLLITAVGPISPSGIAVATDLALAGDLELTGQLPYLTAVEFQGKFDTGGSAAVNYGCGDCVAITEEIGNRSGVNANVNSGSSTVRSCAGGKYY